MTDPTRQHLDERPCAVCGSPGHGSGAHWRLLNLELDPKVKGSRAEGLIKRCDAALEGQRQLELALQELKYVLDPSRRLAAADKSSFTEGELATGMPAAVPGTSLHSDHQDTQE